MVSPTANLQLKIQNFGHFLTKMIMPNMSAFIAWGLLTVIFVAPGGWFPNSIINAHLIKSTLHYLLPSLIGYTGGKLIYGRRGGVVGAITTMGAISSAAIPMLLGAMVVGPLSGWMIKTFDYYINHRIKSGFEMLINNFSAGIIGLLLALLVFTIIGPIVTWFSLVFKSGVDFLVHYYLLPFISVIVEPAKVLFLNNAITHGVFIPIGSMEVAQQQQSILFLIEANPGLGLGLLLAYCLFSKDKTKDTTGGAAIIHFFGSIHEIYFPYVLANLRLIIAMVIRGVTGIFTLTLFYMGLVSPVSPGSILAIMTVVSHHSYLGILVSVALATLVTFIISAIILKKAKVK